MYTQTGTKKFFISIKHKKTRERKSSIIYARACSCLPQRKVSISFQHTHHLKRGDDVTSEKKAKKLLGREKKLLGVRRVRAFAPSFSLSFS